MSIAALQQAIDLIEDGRPGEAVPHLEELAGLVPAYVTVHVLLARVYEVEGRWGEAQAAWRQAYFLMPNSPAIRDGLHRATEAKLEATAPLTEPLYPTPAPTDEGEAEAPAGQEAEASVIAPLRGPDGAPQAPHPEPPPAGFFSAPAGVGSDAEERGAEEEAYADAEDFTEAYTAEDEAREEGSPEELEETAPVRDVKVESEDPVLVGEDLTSEDLTTEESESSAEGISDDFAEEAPLPYAPPPGDTTLYDSRGRAISQQAFAEIEDLIDEKLRELGVDDPLLDELDDGEAVSPPRPLPDAAEAEQPADVLAASDDDLDSLIERLETASRIAPVPDLDAIPAPELDDEIEDMVSETLARIYASQGQYEEAARVYEQLALQQPDETITFLQRAAEMRGRAQD